MSTIKQKIKQVRQRSYLGKDFNSMRLELSNYAKNYYADQIKDVSENSVAGMFIDMAAYVGDVMSYYLDYQFNELDINTAVNLNNIEKLIRQSGIKIGGASPSLLNVSIYVVVPANSSGTGPNTTYMPKVLAGSQFLSNSGVVFELLEDVDFSKTDTLGKLVAESKIYASNSSGTPTKFVLKRIGAASSDSVVSESFTIDNTFIPFRKIELSNQNVTQILSVFDYDGNEYYEVDSLTHDVVYRKQPNNTSDSDIVEDSLVIIPAPRRFTSQSSRQTGKTTLTFGSGNADSLDDDIIPDPSEIALPLYGQKQTFSKTSIDPNALLDTRSLGISPVNTIMTVTYRTGGGLSNNVPAQSVRTVSRLDIQFSPAAQPQIAANVRATIEVNNDVAATGGEDALTIDELRTLAASYSNSQNRIVTKQDVLSRIYTMPSNFGRVFRAGFKPNPVNPLSSLLYVVSRNSDGKLTLSSDTLKINLSKYLNEFRLISDGIDIVDASIVNIQVNYTVGLSLNAVKNTTLQAINSKLKEYFNIKNFQIDQPIVLTDVTNIIINEAGVQSLINLTINNVGGTINDIKYSNIIFNISQNTKNGLIIPPPGGIFEVKYPDFDIIGNVR
jgi:hypothetical protein